ncbi:MAG: sialidase family protein, partial [Verrucomicrobiales bacterium]
ALPISLRTLELPAKDKQGKTIIAPNAGCHQRIDLPNGNILLPIRFWNDRKKQNYTSIVARCRFDGETLTYLEHGSEHTIPEGRGLYEPSAIRHGDAFFLTMRADKAAYVAKSQDGLNYSKAKAWTFDDGEALGSYNTQQHWLSLAGKLYLIYTRRGADNDHIFRHRAPLFIAEVDPEALHDIRATEQILVPENGGTLGNSGVCHLNDKRAWLTVAEGSRPKAESNRLILAEISAE